jgi:hypothetical protein
MGQHEPEHSTGPPARKGKNSIGAGANNVSTSSASLPSGYEVFADGGQGTPPAASLQAGVLRFNRGAIHLHE